jgi:hypothetical protein
MMQSLAAWGIPKVQRIRMMWVFLTALISVMAYYCPLVVFKI